MRTRVRAIAALTAAVVTGALVAAGCGLPNDDGPQAVAADEIPFGLLSPSSSEPSGQGSTSGPEVDLYFVEGDRLSPVPRQVTDAEPTTILESLLAGKTAEDPAAVETLIPSETALNGVSRDGDTLTVDLNDGITRIQGEPLRRAFAQIVYTLTRPAGGINNVLFLVNGEPVNVVTDNGSESGPVNRQDFVLLRAAGPSGTSTTITVFPG